MLVTFERTNLGHTNSKSITCYLSATQISLGFYSESGSLVTKGTGGSQSGFLFCIYNSMVKPLKRYRVLCEAKYCPYPEVPRHSVPFCVGTAVDADESLWQASTFFTKCKNCGCLLCKSCAQYFLSTVWIPRWDLRILSENSSRIIQFSSVTQSCPTLCDPMNCSMPGLPVHHQLSEFTQTLVHRVSDAIQPSHPLSSPFPLAPNPSQHQSQLFA